VRCENLTNEGRFYRLFSTVDLHVEVFGIAVIFATNVAAISSTRFKTRGEKRLGRTNCVEVTPKNIPDEFD